MILCPRALSRFSLSRSTLIRTGTRLSLHRSCLSKLILFALDLLELEYLRRRGDQRGGGGGGGGGGKEGEEEEDG
eukprot:752912-Rhodomonas_salina.2